MTTDRARVPLKSFLFDQLLAYANALSDSSDQLMTTATTVLALIRLLTSTGRGSDIMLPMAIPSFGCMMIEVMIMLVVPVLYCSAQEWKLWLGIEDPRFAQHEKD